MLKSVIIIAENKKAAKAIAFEKYGPDCLYFAPWEYMSKGNTAYEFKLTVELYNSVNNVR